MKKSLKKKSKKQKGGGTPSSELIRQQTELDNAKWKKVFDKLRLLDERVTQQDKNLESALSTFDADIRQIQFDIKNVARTVIHSETKTGGKKSRKRLSGGKKRRYSKSRKSRKK